MPHGQCYLWDPTLIGLHAISNVLITLAYYSIPVTLTVLARRSDLPLRWLFWLFAAFIVACGTGHLLDVVTIWQPLYWLSGGIRAFTALVSLYTAAVLVFQVPQALAIPNPMQLALTNQELEFEIQQRQDSETTLNELNKELERRVEERTLDLQRANSSLMRYARLQQLIAQLGQDALSGIPLSHLMTQAVDGIVTTLEVDYGYILAKSVDGSVELVASWGLGDTSLLDFEVKPGSEIDYILSTTDPVVINDLSIETRFPHRSLLLQRYPATSGLGIRIPGNPEAFGLLNIWTQTPRQFNQDEIDSLEAVTVLLATLIEQQNTKIALQRNEARLQLALDNSPISMFTQDTNLRYSWIYNPQQGVEADEWIGRTDDELLGADNAQLIELKRQVLQSKTRARQRVDVHLNGTTGTYDIILEPLDTGRRIAGLVGVAINITDLQAVERLKDEFLSMVSHELRTPLSSLHGSLTLLATGRLGELKPQGARLLDIATRNTERLSRLVSDILDLERLESGKIALDKQPCDAADLINQAIATMTPMANEVGIKLVSHPSPIKFWADPDRILQILTNLISNAVKFSPSGSQVTIEVGYEWDTQILFKVRDEGRGIPKEKINTIFDQFQQVDASDSRQKGGTGLGLSICRSIVRQHDGSIWVRSQLGQGSTFYFSLPLGPSTGA